MLATTYGYPGIVGYLSQHEANVNYKDENGWTPLHRTVQNG